MIREKEKMKKREKKEKIQPSFLVRAFWTIPRTEMLICKHLSAIDFLKRKEMTKRNGVYTNT